MIPAYSDVIDCQNYNSLTFLHCYKRVGVCFRQQKPSMTSFDRHARFMGTRLAAKHRLYRYQSDIKTWATN